MSARDEKEKYRTDQRSITEYICDELCRHPREAEDQEELDAICRECLLSKEIQ